MDFQFVPHETIPGNYLLTGTHLILFGFIPLIGMDCDLRDFSLCKNSTGLSSKDSIQVSSCLPSQWDSLCMWETTFFFHFLK